MKEQLKYLSTTYKAIQIVLGMLFVISGFVKGVDPIGVFYNRQLSELIFLKTRKQKRKEHEEKKQ